MSNEVSSSPSRSPVSAREYGSTPCGRSSGPASTACSLNRAARFPVASEGQVEFEPPGPENARLEPAAAFEGQEKSSPHGEGREVRTSPRYRLAESSTLGELRELGSSPRKGQEGSGPHEGYQQGEEVPPPEQTMTSRSWRHRSGCGKRTCDGNGDRP